MNNTRQRIYAGIVSYNPSLEKIKANIDALAPQVDVVIVCDNGSDNVDDVERLCGSYSNVRLLRNGANLGIAVALNDIFKAAAVDGANWVLTLDQDSCVDKNFISECEALLEKPEAVSITTLRRDRNCSAHERYDESLPVETVKWCITSGNLVRVTAWREVRGFNESLFMDGVDYEFSYRLRDAGHEIYRINKVLLTHELGNSKVYRFLWKTPVAMNHSPQRKYYIYRSKVYLMRHVPLSHEGKPFIVLLKGLMTIVLYEDQKWVKLKASLKGIADGLRMSEYDYPEIVLESSADESVSEWEGGYFLSKSFPEFTFAFASEMEAMAA